MVKGEKNPSHFMRTVIYRTVDWGAGKKSFKLYILGIHQEQNNQWASEVCIHGEGQSVACMLQMLGTMLTVHLD